MTIPTVWPLDFPCNQRFGANPASYQPDGHTGMDFACPRGTPIRAAAAGTVLYADWAQGLGWPNPYYIAIDFDGPSNGDQSAGIVVVIDHGPFATVYGHLDATHLNPGQKVAMGEIIGKTGNTGFSSGPHLHFEVLPDKWNVLGPYYGRVNPELYIGLAPTKTELAPNERYVAAGRTARGRTEPVSTAAEVRAVGEGQREVFDGWAYGESVNGVNTWLHDSTPAWYWSGNFDPDGVGGLPDLNKAAPPADPGAAAHQRDTGALGVNRRSAPDKNSALLETFGPDLRLDMRGYVKATDPYGDGNTVWFVGAYGDPTFFHSSAFTNPGTDGLRDLTAELFPPGGPAPAVQKPYDFALDFAEIGGIKVEKIPAALSNVDVGNIPASPTTAVCHWWNRLEVNPSLASVINEFTRKDSFKSAHWLVDELRIVQMVSMRDRAYHAGTTGNNYIGIEISPFAIEKTVGGEYTARAKRIQQNVRALLEALRGLKGYKFQTTLHKNVPGNATSCSELDLALFEPEPPKPPTQPDLPTTPVIPPGLTDEQVRELEALADYLLARKGTGK